MEKTNIEYFNNYLKMFVENIIETFPEFKEPLTEYYGEVLGEESSSDDKHVKRFMRKMKEHKTHISQKSDQLFSESICILKNIDFKEIWEREDLSENNRATIWEYIQTLFVLGETIISDCDRVQNLIKNFRKLRETMDGSQDSSNGESSNIGEEPSEEDKEMLEMLKNLTENKNTEPLPETFFTDGMIGKLAQELSEEIDVNSLNMNMDNANSVDDIFGNLMGGDNPMKFMNLLQSVGQKIQSKVESGALNQEKLVEEAQSMMGALHGNNPLLDTMLKKTQQMAEQQQSHGSQMRGRTDDRTSSTRDRLRKKLEARQNAKK